MSPFILWEFLYVTGPEELFVKSALLYSETTSGSDVGGVRSLEVAKKIDGLWVAVLIRHLQIEPALLRTPLPCFKLGKSLEDCEFGGSSCDSRIIVSV